jgi:hypothetical protein
VELGTRLVRTEIRLPSELFGVHVLQMSILGEESFAATQDLHCGGSYVESPCRIRLALSYRARPCSAPLKFSFFGV